MEKVLVTGGSGYIAQHCIAELLKKGYSVRTSLRSENREAEVRQAIAKEVDAKNNLEFCKLDLLKDEGWDEAVAGCTYVLHVASPLTDKAPDDENEILTYRKLIVSHSKDPIDTSYLNFKDLIGFEKSCNLAKSIGFAGKACIHPGQVDISNKIF